MPTTRCMVDASPPCCVTACSDTSISPSRWSTSFAGALLQAVSSRSWRATPRRRRCARRWDAALASFDARSEIGVLGVATRADTVEELSELIRRDGVEPLRWYGVWLFVDWLDLSGVKLDPSDSQQLAAAAAVELEASRRDPYRQLSRIFHVVGRKGLS